MNTRCGGIRFGWKINDLFSQFPQDINETDTIYSSFVDTQDKRTQVYADA